MPFIRRWILGYWKGLTVVGGACWVAGLHFNKTRVRYGHVTAVVINSDI